MRAATVARVAASGLVSVGAALAGPAGWATAVDGCDGVLVVVEGRALGGTVARCAANPTDGLSALRQAGFAVTLGTGRYAGGFICALDARPARGCDVIDADTYWSYWSMQPGTDRWVYSSVGAASTRPKAGGIEAWVWQDDGAVEPPSPRSAVPPAPAPAPAPSPAPAPAPQPPVAGQGRPPSPAPGSAGAPAAAGTAPEPAASAPPAGAAQAGTSTSAVVESPTPSAAAPWTSEPSLAVAAARSDDGPGGSGPAGWTGAAGLLVAALIGADAVRRARARRRDAG